MEPTGGNSKCRGPRGRWWLLSLLEEYKQASLVREAVLGDEVREVGRSRACGNLWPMVRRQEGGGSLGLTLPSASGLVGCSFSS